MISENSKSKSNFFQNVGRKTMFESSTPSMTNNCFFMPFQQAKFGEKIHMIRMPPPEIISEKTEQSKCNQSQDCNYFDIGIDLANLTLYSQKKNDDNLMEKNQQLSSISITPDELLKQVEQFEEKKNREITELENEIKKSKSMIEKLSQENEQLKMQTGRNSVSKLSQTIPMEMIENLNTRCANYEMNLDSILREFEEMRQETSKLAKTLKFTIEQRNERELQIEQYKISLQKMQSEYFDELETLNSKLDEQQQSFRAKEAEYERKVEQSNNESMRMIKKVCGEYEEKISSLTISIQQGIEKLAKLNNEFVQLKANKIRSNKELEELIKSNDELKSKIENMEKISEENQKLQLDLNAKNLEVKKNEDSIIVLRGRLEEKEHKCLNHVEQMEKITNESFNLCEDARKLYFLVKKQKSSLKQIEEIKAKLVSNLEEQQKQLLQNQQESERLKQANESLLMQVKSADAVNAMCETMQNRLQKMLDTKDEEFKKKLAEKDEIIIEQQNKIHQYMENIKLAQMEKEKVLRSFHEKVLDSLKQSSSISYSAVSPITSDNSYKTFNKTSQSNDENQNTTAFDNQQCQENHEKTLDAVINTNDQQVGNTGPTTKDFRLPQSSSSSILKSQKSNTVLAHSNVDISNSIAATSINKAGQKSKPSSTIAPILAQLANDDADEALIVPDTLNESFKNDYKEAKSTESTAIVGILKRKTPSCIDSKNTTGNNPPTDNKNLPSKKIRFASDVVDNEKPRATRASKLPIYKPVKGSIYDSSSSKRNLNEKTNASRSKKLKNTTSKYIQLPDDSDSEGSLAWIDDVFAFP
ncbi:hypothetical protein DERF_004369 [Dermatophagoides farinae]|uniref:Uncharacterized protein n=1 Tax=Dermatophagoides farinae TaxID=6954 RepID=A0A922L5G2_DERFA|nr:putative leucine-rich repeat-containing protein DDB_G0290503 [Dermatophagoides farinae]KAH7644953.1 hypothetical protein HUG17_0491 [Dermatophagoides farinae]KAH9520674.1 hypothetical protein DERF_004369 [Dermatophagoides farinae]